MTTVSHASHASLPVPPLPSRDGVAPGGRPWRDSGRSPSLRCPGRGAAHPAGPVADPAFDLQARALALPVSVLAARVGRLRQQLAAQALLP